MSTLSPYSGPSRCGAGNFVPWLFMQIMAAIFGGGIVAVFYFHTHPMAKSAEATRDPLASAGVQRLCDLLEQLPAKHAATQDAEPQGISLGSFDALRSIAVNVAEDLSDPSNAVSVRRGPDARVNGAKSAARVSASRELLNLLFAISPRSGPTDVPAGN